ncbi:MAG: hypothetical protein RQ760_20460 [Sedimentisphaerales bacterium]|nr:hypothetical protein [Sedimentisphaerales bacterium]
MGILAALSRPGSKDIERSKYDQATLEFATASDSQDIVNVKEAENGQVTSEPTSSDESPELVDITEAEFDKVTSEFTPSDESPELVDITEAEFDQIISDLYQKTEEQCNQIISTIKSESENDPVTSELPSSDDSPELGDITESENDQAPSEFVPFFDYPELVDGTEVEFDRIISDLYRRTEDQCNRIGEIIKSEAEYNRVTSEFAPSFDCQELVDGTEADFDRVISDLYNKAKDQCSQIISTIRKAFEADLEYADALCDLKIAYEDKGESDLTELHKEDKQMKTIKHFRLHIDTCDIYAIEQRADATLVGSCGPLAEDDLKDLDSYDYSDKQNAWVQKNLNKLILWFP